MLNEDGTQQLEAILLSERAVSSTKRGRPLTSSVWKYFGISDDGKTVRCVKCQKEITGGKHTVNAIGHLKAKHPEEYVEYRTAEANKIAEKKKQDEEAPKPLIQPTISFKETKPYEADSKE